MTPRSTALALAGVDGALAAELAVHVATSRNLLRRADRDISPRMAGFLEQLRRHVIDCPNVSQPGPLPARPEDNERAGSAGDLLRKRDDLTVSDLVAIMRVGRSSLYRMWSAGRGPRYTTQRGRRYVTVEDFITWWEQAA